MEIHSIGIHYVHKSGVVINRPEGSGDYLLIIFKTPAYITLGGVERAVAPDSAMLFAKGTPQLYGNADDLYINHCVHFDLDDLDTILKDVGLETDMPFVVYNIDRVEAVLKEISYEFYSGKEKEEITRLLLWALFHRLGESCKDYKKGKISSGKLYETEMKMLRSEIYSIPSSVTSVAEMAAKLSISVSHFQRLYKKYFGISCYEDVVNARISMAKEYLKNTLLGVNEVAVLCGYASYEHFIRQFKARTGHTPYQYRLMKIN